MRCEPSLSSFLFQVKNKDDDFGWGVVVNFQKKIDQSGVCKTCRCFFVFVLVCVCLLLFLSVLYGWFCCFVSNLQSKVHVHTVFKGLLYYSTIRSCV